MTKPNKFSIFITKHPKTIVLAALILLIPSIIGYALTGVNYDILSYLPEEINSVEGEKILDETFHNASSVMLVVENFKPEDVVKLKEEISQVEYVTKVMWSDDILDITVPQSSLPSAVRKIFYSQDGNATLLLINLSCSSSSDEASQAIHDIRNIADKNCFISGMSAILTDTKELADSQAPIYIAFAIALALQGNDRAFTVLAELFNIINKHRVNNSDLMGKAKLTLALANTMKGNFLTSEEILTGLATFWDLDTINMDHIDFKMSENISTYNLIRTINNFMLKNYENLRQDLCESAIFAQNTGLEYHKNLFKTMP